MNGAWKHGRSGISACWSSRRLIIMWISISCTRSTLGDYGGIPVRHTNQARHTGRMPPVPFYPPSMSKSHGTLSRCLRTLGHNNTLGCARVQMVWYVSTMHHEVITDASRGITYTKPIISPEHLWWRPSDVRSLAHRLMICSACTRRSCTPYPRHAQARSSLGRAADFLVSWSSRGIVYHRRV